MLVMPSVQQVPLFAPVEEHDGLLDMYSPGMLIGENGPPGGPVYPALATQAVMVLLAGGELELFGQFVHIADLIPEYVLATHDSHAVAPNTLEYVPAVQLSNVGRIAFHVPMNPGNGDLF